MTLTLPEFFDTVKSLPQTVDVDYIIPGCPPEEKTTWLALEALIENKLPPKGTVISHNVKAVCDDCPRKKDVKKGNEILPTFPDNSRPGNLFTGTGTSLCRNGDTGRLRGSLPAG